MREAGLLLLCAALSGCGYHVAGRGDNVPKSIRTIAVPVFKNETPRFKLEQALTAAVMHELITRTRYQIQPEEDSADAVLRGALTGYWSIPVVFDPRDGRATTVQINVRMRVSLVERKTSKVLWENQDYVYSERYEIGRSASGYFEESGAAVDRLSKTLARALVSAVLEGF